MPICARTGAVLHLCAALDRGETLMVPQRVAFGLTAEMLAHAARSVGAPVIVVEGLAEVTTRERVEA